MGKSYSAVVEQSVVIKITLFSVDDSFIAEAQSMNADCDF